MKFEGRVRIYWLKIQQKVKLAFVKAESRAFLWNYWQMFFASVKKPIQQLRWLKVVFVSSPSFSKWVEGFTFSRQIKSKKAKHQFGCLNRTQVATQTLTEEADFQVKTILLNAVHFLYLNNLLEHAIVFWSIWKNTYDHTPLKMIYFAFENVYMSQTASLNCYTQTIHQHFLWKVIYQHKLTANMLKQDKVRKKRLLFVPRWGYYTPTTTAYSIQPHTIYKTVQCGQMSHGRQSQ